MYIFGVCKVVAVIVPAYNCKLTIIVIVVASAGAVSTGLPSFNGASQKQNV